MNDQQMLTATTFECIETMLKVAKGETYDNIVAVKDALFFEEIDAFEAMSRLTNIAHANRK